MSRGNRAFANSASGLVRQQSALQFWQWSGSFYDLVGFHQHVYARFGPLLIRYLGETCGPIEASKRRRPKLPNVLILAKSCDVRAFVLVKPAPGSSRNAWATVAFAGCFTNKPANKGSSAAPWSKEVSSGQKGDHVQLINKLAAAAAAAWYPLMPLEVRTFVKPCFSSMFREKLHGVAG